MIWERQSGQSQSKKYVLRIKQRTNTERENDYVEKLGDNNCSDLDDSGNIPVKRGPGGKTSSSNHTCSGDHNPISVVGTVKSGLTANKIS
jgi:hypothetical protein